VSRAEKQKTLYLAEKPSVGRDLARVLPGTFIDHKTHLESDNTIITWAVGHLLRLAHPEEYDEKLKRWRMAALPIVPDSFKLKPAGGRGADQLRAVKKLLARDDVVKIVNACDAGREGELIFAYIMESTPKKVQAKERKRLWLSSMTDEAIRRALADLRQPPRDLEDAARSRSEADWVVGINATRAATLRLKKALDGVATLGRVQTPTLAILARREQEIADFVPEKYAEIHADFQAKSGLYKGKYVGKIDKKKADEIVRAIKKEKGEIASVKKSERREKVPMLYDLTSLQRDANSRYGFSAKKTLALAQRLYEHHKLLTYPRTSSRFLTDDMYAKFPGIIREVGMDPDYKGFAGYLAGKKLARAMIDDKKVKDHHAIIPTEGEQKTDKLDKDEARLYDMVVRRFLAVFYPEAVAESTVVLTEVEKDGERHTFRTRGKRYKEKGWRELYEAEDMEIPELGEGEGVAIEKIEAEEKETKPPRRYSDASLLGAMESAGRDLDDEEAREAMKESGLGTPATRAAILEKLLAVDYLEREGKALKVTGKGMKLVELLEKSPLLSAELTGKWEKELLRIEEGEKKGGDFMKEIDEFIRSIVRELDALSPPAPVRAEMGPCPGCGKTLLENRKGVSCWRHDDPGCGFVIWKKVAGKNLSLDTIRELLENKRTEEAIQGFRGKKGRTFRARLKLEKVDGKWSVAFDEDWAREKGEEESQGKDLEKV
jgi:DNA topoisomerase-3